MSVSSYENSVVAGDTRLLGTVELMREQGILMSREAIRQMAKEQSARNYARMMKEEREAAEADVVIPEELAAIVVEAQVELETVEQTEAAPIRHLRLVA